jgi:murein DD-endopeptidase MepM/ murein hydrolase activator NlpD
MDLALVSWKWWRAILLLSLIVGGTSAVWSKSAPTSLATFRSQLAKQQAVVLEFKQRLTTLEGQLGRDNSDLLSLLKVGEDLEREIAFLSERVVITHKQIGQQREQAVKEYNQLMIYLVDRNQDASTLVLTRAMSKRLEQKISQLGKAEVAERQVATQLELLTTALQSNLLKREQVGNRLGNLEQEKNRTAQSYLSAVKRRVELNDKLADLERSGQKKRRKKSIKKAAVKISAKLSAPLGQFISKQHKSKGITYRYKGVRPVMATGDGEVVYLGELSTYGNLLIINHGNKTRSILLGEFTPKVKKGRKIKRGELIGYTSRLASTVGDEGQLYFEVRQGEIIQNTALLLDRRDRTKNNLSNKSSSKKEKNRS